MNAIPKKLREEMGLDPFYARCCLRGDGQCSGKVEWHHALIVAGKQLQAKFCILPACKEYHHRFADRKDIKERFAWVYLNRATPSEIASISKAINYKSQLDILNKKYGMYS